jgi:hypothetical protein
MREAEAGGLWSEAGSKSWRSHLKNKLKQKWLEVSSNSITVKKSHLNRVALSYKIVCSHLNKNI